MTPDGTPIVGPKPVQNLLLATGHGTLGWTMVAGTGRVIANMVATGTGADLAADNSLFDSFIGLEAHGREA